MNGSSFERVVQKPLLVSSFIAIIVALIILSCDSNPSIYQKETYESVAKFALRAYGETQRAYSYNYIKEHYYYPPEDDRQFYATWDDLKRFHYLSDGITKANLVPNYQFWTSVKSYSVFRNRDTGRFSLPPRSTFTAVAFPKILRPAGYLSTFSIREDNVLRVYVRDVLGERAWGEDGDFGTKTWDEVD